MFLLGATASWARTAVLGACALASAPVAAATLSRGPYLQQVTTESALVVWRTSAAAACTLSASAPGLPTLTITTASATQHVAALSGLAPATRYDYVIRSAGTLASGSNCFLQTAPLPNTGATTRFLVFGDTGTGNATQAAVAAQLNAETVNFGLHVGDIIYPGGEAHYYDPRYFTPYAPLLRHTPIWAAIGNHDEVTPSSFNNAWYLPTNPVNGSERFYSFDYGDIHLVALDTTEPFSTAILNWLRTDLQSTTRRWKVVFFHHTLYSCGDYHGSSNSLVSLLTPIFEDYNVDLVLYGHDHHYERSYPMRDGDPVGVASDPDYVQPGAPIYVISGAGGTTRSSSDDCEHTARALSTPSFVRVEITGDDLQLQAVGADGHVLDQMTLSKTTSPPPPPPPDVVTVMAPNGGETVTMNSTLDLRWTASPAISLVGIEISRTSVTGPWEVLFPITSNDGHEDWTVTGPASPTCWLRVFDPADGSPSDISNASFAIVTPPDLPPPGTAIVRVCFQPGSAPVPFGYFADTGAVFTTLAGRGWDTVQSVVARGALIGDPRDSFVDVNNLSLATWEVVVPNGGYRVSLTCGDTQTSATHRIALEGQVVVADEYTVGGEFLQRVDLPVTVIDGRLSVELGGIGNATHTKLNAIVIVPATSTDVPYVLETPSAGETRCLGLVANVSWTGSGAPTPLHLQLSRSGLAGPWEMAASYLVDDGNEMFTVYGAESNDCRFRLLDASGAILAVNDGPFSLSSARMQLIAPNGGETWVAGAQHTFAWTSTCFMGSVRIDVSRTGPSGPWTTLISSTANDGVESWLVREEDVGWTHARVGALPFLVPGDLSDAPFSVYEPEISTTHWNVDFTTAAVAPIPGTTADIGQVFTVDRGFGWHQSVQIKQRDMMPGDCRDTFVQVVNNTTATWEMALANGEYIVTPVCGDPFTSGTHRLALEGEIVVQDVYAIGGTFVSNDYGVRVEDGRLTVTLGGSGAITSTKLACLQVTAVPSQSPRGQRDPLELEPITKVEIGPTRLDLAAGPIRSATDVALSLALGGHVRIDVLDVRGRRVATVLDRDLPAGRHVVRWDAVDGRRAPLPSGVYFLRLEAPGARDSHKIVLVR